MTITYSMCYSVIIASSWAKRRETLDQQEAELLSHVRSLRQRVMQQSSLHSEDVNSRNTSHSTGPLKSALTHITDHHTSKMYTHIL